jgi:protocatechuate 3,4-dioxygenase beta subunit
MSRGATLSGTLTDPDGAPLAGVRVVLHSSFLWEFAHARTDARGRYRFEDQKARGWDMSAWRKGTSADGTYKLWIDDDQFAVPTESVTLEPGTSPTRDLRAAPAGAIRVTVVEEGTNRRVAGARVSAYEATRGGGARFTATTDGRGQATFHATPSRIVVTLEGPPEGVYLARDFVRSVDASQAIELAGLEADAVLLMPPIAGTLVAVSGTCTDRAGAPVAGAVVSATAGHFAAPGAPDRIRDGQADRAGRFTVEGIPSGRMVHLYAETRGRTLAGMAAIAVPKKADPGLRATLTLVPTVAADRVLAYAGGKPLASRKFRITPMAGEDEFLFLRRSVMTDAEGRLKVDGIVPGLAYRVEEETPPAAFRQVIVLAPVEAK